MTATSIKWEGSRKTANMEWKTVDRGSKHVVLAMGTPLGHPMRTDPPPSSNVNETIAPQDPSGA